MIDVGRTMAKGAVWMVTSKLLERGLGLLSTLVLARLLVPADFGIVAMAMSIIAILELLGTFSFDIPLIQNPDAAKHHYDTAWTFNVLFGVSAAILLLTLAVPTSIFYEEPRLPLVILVLAVGTLIQGFENVGIVAFRKEMRFDREFRFLLGKRLCGFVVTVTLAVLLGNYWALVVGTVTARTAGVALSYYMHPFRPSFSLAGRHDLFNFSKWLLLNNLLFFANNKSADFVVGKVAGPRGLGLYSIGYEIANLPTTELVAPINRAVFPGYAKAAGNQQVLRAAYIDVIAMIMLLALPCSAGIAVTAQLLVPVVLGNNWVDAIPVMQILALYGGVIAMQTNMAAVYLALAKPRVLTALAAVNLVVLMPTLITFTNAAGATGAAWAYLVTALVIAPVNFFVLLRSLQLPLSTFLGALWRPLSATLVMAAIVIEFTGRIELWLGDSLQILQLLGAVLLGAVVYTICVLLLWIIAAKPPGAEGHILAEGSKRLARIATITRKLVLAPRE